jgi:hypothetical protein
MKNCPYCGREIQDAAIKCRFCGEWLGNNSISKGNVPINRSKEYENRLNRLHGTIIVFACIYLISALIASSAGGEYSYLAWIICAVYWIAAIGIGLRTKWGYYFATIAIIPLFLAIITLLVAIPFSRTLKAPEVRKMFGFSDSEHLQNRSHMKTPSTPSTGLVIVLILFALAIGYMFIVPVIEHANVKSNPPVITKVIYISATSKQREVFITATPHNTQVDNNEAMKLTYVANTNADQTQVAATYTSIAAMGTIFPTPVSSQNNEYGIHLATVEAGRREHYSPSDCTPWSNVSLADAGKTMCVYGTVTDTTMIGEVLYMSFSNRDGDFQFIHYGGNWFEGVENDCSKAEGKIERLGNNPVMVVDDNSLYYCD